MPQLDWTTYPSQLFWLLVTFFLLWGLMTFFILPPVQKILDQRRGYIKELTAEAETLREKSQRLEQENARLLQDIRAECERQVLITLQEKREALKTAAEETNQESQKQLRELTEKIALMKRDALEEVQGMVPQLRDLLLTVLPSLSSQRRKS